MIRVLLVEDDKNLCFILKSSLEQMIGGYEVTAALNGKEGLELLEQRPFDVIVSDVEMPVMDGMTMVQHIRRRYPRLAVIFITGLTTARDVINGYQSGADFYIKKPFLPEELNAHIQAVLKMKQSAPAPQTVDVPAEEEYAIGSYRFLPSQHQLCYGEERQALTPKEAQILEMLCRRKGQALPPEGTGGPARRHPDRRMGNGRLLLLAQPGRLYHQAPQVSFPRLHRHTQVAERCRRLSGRLSLIGLPRSTA